MSNWLHAEYLPPGLRELAEDEDLTEEQVKKLAAAWGTIRGHRPKTLAEWQLLWNAIRQYFEDDQP